MNQIFAYKKYHYIKKKKTKTMISAMWANFDYFVKLVKVMSVFLRTFKNWMYLLTGILVYNDFISRVVKDLFFKFIFLSKSPEFLIGKLLIVYIKEELIFWLKIW